MSAPIEPVDYLYGVRVVDIGDARVKRGKTRREKSACRHMTIVYDTDERRLYCEDCKSDVDAFDVFIGYTEYIDTAFKKLNQRAAEVKVAEGHALISRAAKAVDKIWRSLKMTVCCPHCNRGILPDDVLRGLSQTSRQYELKRRQKEGEQ